MVRSNMARATRLLCSAISFLTGSPCERTGGAERPVCHSLASQGWGARPLLVLSGRQDDGCRGASAFMATAWLRICCISSTLLISLRRPRDLRRCFPSRPRGRRFSGYPGGSLLPGDMRLV